MKAYLSQSGSSPGQIMAAAGVAGNFSSHSFRIGAATVAARDGIPDHLIRALRRWTSNAYQLYIRTPSEALASLSLQLSLDVGLMHSSSYAWFL